jgi:hypothetical protein
MSFPSGFGLVAVYPSLVADPPGFAFFRSGSSPGLIDLYLASSTGIPKVLFSTFSGEVPTLNLISGNNNDFYFNQGRMRFGNGTIGGTSGSGALQVYWNGDYTSNTDFGFGVNQTDFNAGYGPPQIVKRTNANLKYTEVSNFVGSKALFKSNLGGYASATLPGIYDFTAANTYSSFDYVNPQVNSATIPSNFMGFGWGMWDGAYNLFSVLKAQRDSVEVGYFQEFGTRTDIGGKGSFVIRHANVNPTTFHPSGTILFSSGNSSLNVRTSSGVNIQLAPGITGVNRYAHSDDIYRTLDYGINDFIEIGAEYDGKILYNTKATDHFINFEYGPLVDGFSCQIIHQTSAACTMSSTDNDYLTLAGGTLRGPGLGGRTFVSVKGNNLYLNNCDTSSIIHLPVGQLYPTTVSGAATGLITTTTNKIDYKVLDFDQSAIEYAQGDFLLPLGWDSFKCQFIWTCGTVGAGAVMWGARGIALADFGALDVIYGPPQNIIDTKVTSSGVHISSFTSSITPPIPAAYAPIKLQVYRNATNASDTFTADARLLGVTIIKT